MNYTSFRSDYKSANLNLQTKDGDISFSRLCLLRLILFQGFFQISKDFSNINEYMKWHFKGHWNWSCCWTHCNVIICDGEHEILI